MTRSGLSLTAPLVGAWAVAGALWLAARAPHRTTPAGRAIAAERSHRTTRLAAQAAERSTVGALTTDTGEISG